MIEKIDFKNFTEKIITTVYSENPDQLLVYKLESNDWVDALYSNKSVEKQDVKTSLEGGATIQSVIQSLSVIVGTFKMLKEAYGLIKTKIDDKEGKANKIDAKIDSLKIQWKEKLIKENIDEEIANRIVNEFSKEILKF